MLAPGQRPLAQQRTCGASHSCFDPLTASHAQALETLRREGLPSPGVRSLAWACLRYLDGALLNALLLRWAAGSWQ